MLTRRARIREELEKRSMSIEEISRFIGMSSKEVLRELTHIQKTLRAEKKRLIVLYPVCNSCNRQIRLKKLTYITKCPYCKSTHITPARFSIEG